MQHINQPEFIIDPAVEEHALFLRKLHAEVSENPSIFAQELRAYEGGVLANQPEQLTELPVDHPARKGAREILSHYFNGTGDSRNRYDRSLAFDEQTEDAIDSDVVIIANRRIVQAKGSRKVNVGGKLVREEHPEAVEAREIIRHRTFAIFVDRVIESTAQTEDSTSYKPAM